MDKNMINIDDLVRQRLSGAEEEERAGAWLRMRELLDKEEPVRVAAGYNWKRMLTYAGGLLLLATATIGGYQAYQSFNDGKQDSNAAFTAYNSGNKGLLAGVSLNDASTGNQTATNTQSLQNQQQTATKNLQVEKLQQNATKSTLITTNTPVAKAEKLISNNKTSFNTNNNDNSLQPQRNNDVVTATNNNLPAGQVSKQQQNNTSINNTKPNRTENTVATASVTKATSSISEQQNPSLPANNEGAIMAAKNRNFASGSNTQPVARQQLAPEITNPRYRQQKSVDSINMIATKESSRKGVKKIDTIGFGKLPVDKYAAVVEEPSRNEVMPAASLSEEEAAKEARLEPLSKFKTDRKEYKNKNYNPRRFEEMVQNVKYNLSGVSFHPGLMMGVSSTVGSYNMMGINFGVVGMMDINERWGMFAEFKYQYRFGNGKSLLNNYNRVTNTNYIGNNTFTHEWDSVEHYFNITSASLIELPIALRYSAKRINMFVGVNTAYNFAVKVDEKENPHPKKYTTTNSNTEPLVAQWGENKQIVYNDFGARITMGYMLGVGYQLSPAVNFDLRCSQPIWDNVKTTGAYKVSRELFRTPSFQLNMTYRFSNNKYKPRTREY